MIPLSPSLSPNRKTADFGRLTPYTDLSPGPRPCSTKSVGRKGTLALTCGSASQPSASSLFTTSPRAMQSRRREQPRAFEREVHDQIRSREGIPPPGPRGGFASDRLPVDKLSNTLRGSSLNASYPAAGPSREPANPVMTRSRYPGLSSPKVHEGPTEARNADPYNEQTRPKIKPASSYHLTRSKWAPQASDVAIASIRPSSDHVCYDDTSLSKPDASVPTVSGHDIHLPSSQYQPQYSAQLSNSKWATKTPSVPASTQRNMALDTGLDQRPAENIPMKEMAAARAVHPRSESSGRPGAFRSSSLHTSQNIHEPTVKMSPSMSPVYPTIHQQASIVISPVLGQKILPSPRPMREFRPHIAPFDHMPKPLAPVEPVLNGNAATSGTKPERIVPYDEAKAENIMPYDIPKKAAQGRLTKTQSGHSRAVAKPKIFGAAVTLVSVNGDLDSSDDNDQKSEATYPHKTATKSEPPSMHIKPVITAGRSPLVVKMVADSDTKAEMNNLATTEQQSQIKLQSLPPKSSPATGRSAPAVKMIVDSKADIEDIKHEVPKQQTLRGPISNIPNQPAPASSVFPLTQTKTAHPATQEVLSSPAPENASHLPREELVNQIIEELKPTIRDMLSTAATDADPIAPVASSAPTVSSSPISQDESVASAASNDHGVAIQGEERMPFATPAAIFMTEPEKIKEEPVIKVQGLVKKHRRAILRGIPKEASLTKIFNCIWGGRVEELKWNNVEAQWEVLFIEPEAFQTYYLESGNGILWSEEPKVWVEPEQAKEPDPWTAAQITAAEREESRVVMVYNVPEYVKRQHLEELATGKGLGLQYALEGTIHDPQKGEVRTFDVRFVSRKDAIRFVTELFLTTHLSECHTRYMDDPCMYRPVLGQ